MRPRSPWRLSQFAIASLILRMAVSKNAAAISGNRSHSPITSRLMARLLAQRKPSEFRKDAFQGGLKTERGEHLLVNREHKSVNAIGHHRFKESRLGWDQPVERPHGHPSLLGHFADAGRCIALRLKFLGRGLDDELPRVLVAAYLRPASGPLHAFSGQGRPPSLMRRDKDHRPVSVKELASSLPQSAFETITWREGACEPLSSRFARVRVCPAHRDYNLTAPRPEEWLLIEWPLGEDEPTKYWLSTLPQTVGFASLVDTAKLRWRIERDYLDLKQEIGIGHYEGRGWRGFHHHATLCIAAYAFLILERETIPPSGSRCIGAIEKAGVPEGYRPRGRAAQAGEAHPELHRDTQTQDRRGPGESPATLSLLRQRQTKSNLSVKLVTQ
jgi:hypothetical protein